MRTFVAALAFAAVLVAQPQKSILGTVTEFKMSSLEIGLRPDNGEATYFKILPDTEVLQVEPDERDLSRAQKVRVTDLSLADRVLVTFVAGMPEARRIVLISATDISKRNEAERLDWQKRGVNGTVTAIHGEEITLRTGSVQGPPEITVVVTPRTMVRRYAPDSVKFADAQWSTIADIAVGDQVRTRGNQSADGARLTAEDLVYGSFRSAIGAITAIDTEARKITIESIQKAVAEQFGLRVVEIKAKSNSRAIVFPRQIAMYLAKQMTEASLPEIGRQFGGKHHTTVMHSIDKIEDQRQGDKDLNRLLNKLTETLNS